MSSRSLSRSKTCFLWACATAIALFITPSALSDQLWAVAVMQDNAGNSTGLLLFSALVALGWMQNLRSLVMPVALGALGLVAGFGFVG
jgi:hypothetical protein